MPPSAIVMVVTVIAVVDRDDGVIIAVVEVLRSRRLVVVAITVSGAHEIAGLCRIAHTTVPRQCRVGAERAREGRHAIKDLGRHDLVRRDALLDPLHQWAKEIGAVGPCAATAMCHPRLEEQPGEFLRALQTYFSLPLVVAAPRGSDS